MPRKTPRQPKSKPLEKVPPIPTRLKGKLARDYWKRITVELVRIRAITDLHLEALEVLCEQWQTYKELETWCQKNPNMLVVEYASGHMVEHPKVRLKQTAFTNLTKLWPKFGLTPHGLRQISGNSIPSTGASHNPIQDFASRKTG